MPVIIGQRGLVYEQSILVSRRQLCVTKGGIHPGKGCFGGNLCTFFFFFFLNRETVFQLDHWSLFFFRGLSFKGRIRPLWWDEMVVEDICGIRGMFATILGQNSPKHYGSQAFDQILKGQIYILLVFLHLVRMIELNQLPILYLQWSHHRACEYLKKFFFPRYSNK